MYLTRLCRRQSIYNLYEWRYGDFFFFFFTSACEEEEDGALNHIDSILATAILVLERGLSGRAKLPLV